MNKLLTSFVAAMALSISFAGFAANMTGAGATFPYPVYAKWADTYKKQTGHGLNYQSVGSGAGIKQIKKKTVEFGASDMPLNAQELASAGLIQFPMIMGGLVPVVNVEGVSAGQMKLTGDVIAGIYLGKIKKWNASEIMALNPDLKLPAKEITVVHRSDGSGSTFLWTDYLSKVNAEFKAKVGSGTAVKWPTGLGGKGNEGIAASVLNIKGAIGYVEYAYVKKNNMVYAQLKNRDGQFVTPDDATFKAAAANADWAKAPGFSVMLTDQPGKTSWPITGASFILMHKQQANAVQGREVLQFFSWAFKNGGTMATDLDYVAMPDSVIKLVEETWKKELKDSSGKAVW